MGPEQMADNSRTDNVTDNSSLCEKDERLTEDEVYPTSISARDDLISWLQYIENKQDFIYGYEQPLSPSIDKDFLDRCDGNVCDPIVYLSDQLTDQVVEMRNLSTDQLTNKLRGRCSVKMADGTEMVGTWVNMRREGQGGLSSPNLIKLGVELLIGNYVKGVLHGMGRIHMLDKSIREGWFLNGKLHGPVRGYCKVDGLKWIGYYSNGSVVGTCWRRLEGGAWIIGSQSGGLDTAYLYPDKLTALVGRWKDGQLVSAYPARLRSWEDINGIINPDFQILSRTTYRRWISTQNDIICPPHQSDPFEQQNVYVSRSNVDGGGEGLFAGSDFPPGSLLSFYNGVRIQPGSSIGVTGYGIYLDWETVESRSKSVIMDIPKKYQSSDNYTATLAHKINHSFNPNCEWVHVDHPCFGRIPAVQSLQSIGAGEELFVHYGMDMEEAPDWYLQAWEKWEDAK